MLVFASLSPATVFQWRASAPSALSEILDTLPALGSALLIVAALVFGWVFVVRKKPQLEIVHTVSAEEIAKHNYRDDCWIVVDGRIYDLTSVVTWHPPGAAIILAMSGRDASAAFKLFHKVDRLKPYLLGHLHPHASSDADLRNPMNLLPQSPQETMVHERRLNSMIRKALGYQLASSGETHNKRGPVVIDLNLEFDKFNHELMDSDVFRDTNPWVCSSAGRTEEGNHRSPSAATLKTKFCEWVLDPVFPCVCAKVAVANNRFVFRTYQSFNSPQDTVRLCRDLSLFSLAQTRHWEACTHDIITTFVACFEEYEPRSEENASSNSDHESAETLFEQRLFAQLAAMRRHDPITAAEADTRGRFVFAGRSFFVAGLHPNSQRYGRRFEAVTLVFNAVKQFEMMGNDYGKLHDVNSKRDRRCNGGRDFSVLPLMGILGDCVAFSGKINSLDWSCPLSWIQPPPRKKDVLVTRDRLPQFKQHLRHLLEQLEAQT